MAAVVCQPGRSRMWACSATSGTSPTAGTSSSDSGLADSSSRAFVASMESTDFAHEVMAWAPSANTVQISAGCVEDLRLHRACSDPLRRLEVGAPTKEQRAALNWGFSGRHDG